MAGGPGNIFRSFGLLKGNTRACVLIEPMWGIPYILFNFYLSLYMKARGITDEQIGFLIALGFISGAVFSLFAGMITDSLGRKKTTLIFDFLAWPSMILLYMLAGNFTVFALATVLGGAVRVVTVSWNLMVVEDADTEERVAAFNLLNIINISMGIVTPIAGLLVGRLGIIAGERVLMGLAVISMSAMILLRNHHLTETGVGREILAERGRDGGTRTPGVFLFYGRVFEALRADSARRLILAAIILFNTYVPLGTFSSLYYAPYLTEVLQLGKTSISFLGFLNSFVILLVLALIVPAVTRAWRVRAMILGLVVQALSLLAFVMIPAGRFYLAALCAVSFAVGFGLYRPFIDSLLADVTEGKERAGLYGLQNMTVSLLGAATGYISGYLYHTNPALIYLVSIGILAVCSVLLLFYMRSGLRPAGRHGPGTSASPPIP